MILVTGFPNSGTSFLTNLIVEMGFNPGTRLKGPDNHNRWGYYENLDIRDITWGAIGGKFDPLKVYPAISYSEDFRKRVGAIRKVVEGQSIEVYKDSAGPVVWPLLFHEVDYLIIVRRCEADIAKYYPDKPFREALRRYWTAEESILYDFAKEDWNVGRIFWYGSFKDVCVVESLYHWLKGEWPDEETLSRLRKVYKPR